MADLEWLSGNEQLAKITETYSRLIALDFDNRNIEDIDFFDKNSISWIKINIQDYKNNNLSKENSEKISQISKDIKDFETDAKINNISTDFHENFEANIPKEWEFWFALAYEKLNPPITWFNDYIINSYIHYLSVVNWGWTDKNLVILEWEVYEINLVNKKWELSENPLNAFELKDFKIIEKREWMNKEQKKADAEKFYNEKTEKYWIVDDNSYNPYELSLHEEINEFRREISFSSSTAKKVLESEDYLSHIWNIFEKFDFNELDLKEDTLKRYSKEDFKSSFERNQENFISYLFLYWEKSWWEKFKNIIRDNIGNDSFMKPFIKIIKENQKEWFTPYSINISLNELKDLDYFF